MLNKSKFGRMQIDFHKIWTKSYSPKKPFPGYKLLVEKQDFCIYRADMSRPTIVAAFQNVVVTQKSIGRKQQITIYPDFKNHLIKYRINLTEKKFPGLLSGSKISKCLIVPYLREFAKDKFVKRWRVVIITDKCQVYHNFPSRSKEIEGEEMYGDICRFEESVVWDIPGRRYPSLDKECSDVEEYAPYLNKMCYEYHPSIDEKSKYGNEGFGKYTFVQDGERLVKVSRFYFPNRNNSANPFVFMGGYEPDYKMTLLGTYQSNKSQGARTVIFATSDGGRSWYAKYEFADEGEYSFKQGTNEWGYNFGNPINTEFIAHDYDGRAYFKKRLLSHDGQNKFIWEEPIEISRIYAAKITKIKTVVPHGLITGNIVSIGTEDIQKPNEWNCIFNVNVSCDSCGNGKLFKVELIDEYEFLIYECVSNPFSNIACRHIHHINRVRDGWLIGTGEIYPNGWMLYMQMLEADTYSRISAAEYLHVRILNQGALSVQRTLGADLIDGADPLLVIASDHDKLERKMEIEGAVIPRNSTGIYIGKLADINHFERYTIMYEAKEPAYFFKKIENKYVFSGQRGEFALGCSSGSEWVTARTDEPMIHYGGATYNFTVIDRYLLVIK